MTITEKRVSILLKQIRKGQLTVSGAEQILEERGWYKSLELLKQELEFTQEEI